MKKTSLLIGLILVLSQFAHAQDTNTKFYNFDDLLINGAYQKPAVLLTDSRKKLKFDKLLDLKRDFLYRVKESAKDKSLR
jgi:hypothetical protein